MAPVSIFDAPPKRASLGACNHVDCSWSTCRYKEDRSVYQTKDSGARAEYDSGMVRDTEEGKARFDLLHPKGVPYANQMMTRFAELMARGAKKYGDRNWEKARGQAELDRYESSARRHLEQWAAGEADEDHAAAVMFNILAGETVKFKMSDSSSSAVASLVDRFDRGEIELEDALGQVRMSLHRADEDPC